MSTHRTRINRNIFTIMVALGTLTATGAAANDQAKHAGMVTAKIAIKKAKMGRGMGPDVSFALKLALRGAAKRLEKVHACSALFDDLAIDGLQALGRSRYETPQSQWEQRQCAAGIAAYTAVGSNRVVICGHFHRLDRRVQSAVLIHEALHTAGLSETPVNPGAMSAVEIEGMVEQACGLGH